MQDYDELADDDDDYERNPFANLGMGDTGLEMTGMGGARTDSRERKNVRPQLATLVEEEEASSQEEEAPFPKNSGNEIGFGAFK